MYVCMYLVLDGAANLQNGGTGLKELKSGVGGVNSSCSKNGKSWESVCNGRDGTECNRTNCITAHAAVSCSLLNSYGRPRISLSAQVHQSRNRVCGGDAVSLAWNRTEEEIHESSVVISFSPYVVLAFEFRVLSVGVLKNLCFTSLQYDCGS